MPGADAARSLRAERVVLITIDTLRADHVGAYGGPVSTPHLDALASEGVLVEHACTPTPSTGPAHVSLLTGLYPWRHGTLRNAAPVDPRIPTLADRLKSHGLTTGAFVSSYVLGRRFGFHQGFDTFVFEPSEEYVFRGKPREEFWTRGEVTTRAAMAWITSHMERPFFLWVHYFDPHTPYDPPPAYASLATGAIDVEGKRLPKEVSSVPELKRLIRFYRGEVAYADAQVVKLVERLRLLGLLDGTAVIVASDHGEGLADHGVLEHGRQLFDEQVRVPLVIRAPGLPAGRRLAGNAQLEDLAPTILALVGAGPAKDLDGFDLLPWLRGEVASSPRPVVLGRRRLFRTRRDLFYVRDWPSRSKWIGSLDGRGATFALDEDPGERRPQWGAEVPRALRRALERARPSDPAERHALDPDPEVRRALEALGYAEE